MRKGSLYGVGVGPGDPELVTVKAARVLGACPVVAFFAKKGKLGNAIETAASFLRSDVERLPLYYPYTTEIHAEHSEYAAAMHAFYDAAAAAIAVHLEGGSDVAAVCEGDPLLYGSYMYLHDRLTRRYRCSVIAGITSFAGCAASVGVPLVSTDRVFSVVPATLSEIELERRLRSTDGAAIIKLGRNFPKVVRVLERLGRLDEATYCERGTTSQELAMPLRQKLGDTAIYFSLILLPGYSERPGRPAQVALSAEERGL